MDDVSIDDNVIMITVVIMALILVLHGVVVLTQLFTLFESRPKKRWGNSALSIFLYIEPRRYTIV